MKSTKIAYQKAIKVLEACSTDRGLFASGTPEGYTSVWSRDGNISLLGASLAGKNFKNVFATTLTTLAFNQSPNGQIPNCVGLYDAGRDSEVTYTTIDSACWFLIGEYVYSLAYNDRTLLKKHHKFINKAFCWLSCQDTGEDQLPEQHPTSDWQDAFPHKYGHTINTQALYYGALKLAGKVKEAEEVKKIVNGLGRKDLLMFDGKKGYYLPWIWKDHAGDREQGNWFDSLGNLLAIVTGLAEPGQAAKILDYIEKKKINRPFPVKAIWPPIYRSSPEWHSYFSKCDAKWPYHYLNAGIWPFIGGFYVASLVKNRQFKKAEIELKNLAKANQLGRKITWEFNEWLDGKKGKPSGGVYQAWSAGAYIFAYISVLHKKVPYFN